MPISKSERYINSIVKSFFVDTADHNYILARWSFLHHLHRDFYWNSLHCLEKYLKASLVLNGISVSNQSHAIHEMFQIFFEYSKDIIPSIIIPPFRIDKNSDWTTETMADFISRIEKYGDPNNRYAYFSYFQNWDNLIKLDGVVFVCRRLCVNLDKDISGEDWAQYPNYRAWLKLEPTFQPLGAFPGMPQTNNETRAEELEEALFRLNFAFIKDEKYLCGNLQGFKEENSWLTIIYSIPPDNDRTEVLRWLVANIKFDRRTKAEINKMISECPP